MNLETLRFDSLHKFWVSLGIILIAAPIVLLSVIFLSDPILISADAYDNLSEYSKRILETKQLFFWAITTIGPVVGVASIIIGVFFINRGVSSWKDVQELSDEMLKQRVDKLKGSQASLDEINNDLLQETQEMDEGVDEGNVSSISDQSENPVVFSSKGNEPKPKEERDDSRNFASDSSLKISQLDEIRDPVKEYYQVEKDCFEKITAALRGKYETISNVKVGKGIVDFIAVSTKGLPDVLFEVKYASQRISISILERAALRLLRESEIYQQHFHEKCRCILLIVYGDQVKNAESVSARLNRILQKDYPSSLEAIFINKAQLNLVGETIAEKVCD